MMGDQPELEPMSLKEEVIAGLRDGPANIHQAADTYNALRHQVAGAQREMEAIEAGIAGEIANDKTLTNEAQRKAALAQNRLSNQQLADAREVINALQAKEADAQLALDYARNMFQAARSLAAFLGGDGA